MKRKTIFLIFLSATIFSQSLNDLKKLNNNDLDKLRKQLMSEEKDFNVDRESNNQTINLDNQKSVTLSSPAQISTKNDKYFGYNYFEKNISFFDNVPTPQDYKLGAGDEIILSLWGETNSREKFLLNNDGMIFYDNIGFINLSNLSLSSAELLLKDELSKIYSTIKSENNPTNLTLSLGKLKSINIYFSGHIKNPGINLVHPFSDIFSAIVQSGGISDNGSLREIQLIRNNEIISKVDFYSFFMFGTNTFSNVKLIDGDTIHVPSFKNRISITGAVNRPSSYELLFDESLSDIITYASGLTSNASSNLILNQVVPLKERSTDDNARTSITIKLKDKESIILNNGDTIFIPFISNVDTQVTIYGRVKAPGAYPAVNASLKSVLDIAGGFEDPIFRKSIRENEITILRKDENQFYGTELITSYNESDKLQLLPNDQIFVYENINYRNGFTYRIEGEINKPGTYPFKKGLKIADVVELADGLTNLSSFDNVIVYKEYTSLNENGEQITQSRAVGNVTKDYLLGPDSIIRVLPYENVVSVEGNVYQPGLVAFYKGLTMYEAIEHAGGYMPYSMKKRAFVRKANGEIVKANLFRGRAKRLSAGDTVVVPVNPEPNTFDITTFIADLSTTLANIAAIMLIIDNNSN
jgi:protein involved in polysaccharide export with SLBB domain